jgi:hypothetical protein
MPDPKIETPPEFKFYEEQHGVRRPREFERGSIQGLEKSLSKAHDNLAKQVGINTRLHADLNAVKTARGWDRIWIRILGGCVLVEFAIIGWLVSEFLRRI